MTTPSFQQTQSHFSKHVRDPHSVVAPEGVEDRRVGIYRELVFNNVESLLSGSFPILFKTLGNTAWKTLVREFLVQHQAHTPYFLEISKEFVEFLTTERGLTKIDPPFLLELAHYEWVEIALNVADIELAGKTEFIQSVELNSTAHVSPLAWPLSYQFSVHRIGPDYQPQQPDQPTFVIVYRDRQDKVGFLESNAVTVRLLQLLGEAEQGSSLSIRAALMQIATELQMHDTDSMITNGIQLLEQLVARDIILGFTPIAS